MALAGELVGSTEFIFLGHALRFSLQPRPQGAEPSLMAAKQKATEAKLDANATPSTSISKETLEIIREYVDAYMESRPVKAGSVRAVMDPFFLSRAGDRGSQSKHWFDVESPPPHPRVCMGIALAGRSCGHVRSRFECSWLL